MSWCIISMLQSQGNYPRCNYLPLPHPHLCFFPIPILQGSKFLNWFDEHHMRPVLTMNFFHRQAPYVDDVLGRQYRRFSASCTQLKKTKDPSRICFFEKKTNPRSSICFSTWNLRSPVPVPTTQPWHPLPSALTRLIEHRRGCRCINRHIIK